MAKCQKCLWESYFPENLMIKLYWWKKISGSNGELNENIFRWKCLLDKSPFVFLDIIKFEDFSNVKIHSNCSFVMITVVYPCFREGIDASFLLKCILINLFFNIPSNFHILDHDFFRKFRFLSKFPHFFELFLCNLIEE